MSKKRDITAFVLRILAEILRFVVSCIEGGSADEQKDIKYRQDTQENVSLKTKLNKFIKKHTVETENA